MTNDTPTHEEIAREIQKIIDGNLNCCHCHNRENLNDIISDLIQYQDSLRTADEYMEMGLL
jgi:hypothetical protein